MALHPATILYVSFHLIGMALLTISFIHIATIVYRFSQKLKVEQKVIPGTKLPLRTNMILFGSAGFLLLGFTVAYVTLFKPNTPPGWIRLMATTISVVGNILILSAIYDFYKSISKTKEKGKN